jgi:hypothetical protein
VSQQPPPPSQPPPAISADGNWWWNGWTWVPMREPTRLGSTSLVLAIASWIALFGGFGILGANPNVAGGGAWLAPSPLLAVGAIVVAILSRRVGTARDSATAGLAVGAVSLLANAAYWALAFALTGFGSGYG